MKIDVRNIRDQTPIDISGHEAWLDGIYQYFPAPPDQEHPLVQAKILIKHESNLDGYTLQGQLMYAPFVDCSRCGIKIPWLIKESFDMFFLRKSKVSGTKGEKELEEDDFREYVLEGDHIDLEEILNEQIQLAIPTQTLVINPKIKDTCLNCGKDVSSAQVYGVKPEDDPTNPFAVLKNLKTPH